jgi:uncharacterized protein with HEPN domain
MKGKLGDRQRLFHILEAINEIQTYTVNTDIKSFLSNSMMRFACIKQIEIIGERQIPSRQKQKQYLLIWSGNR